MSRAGLREQDEQVWGGRMRRLSLGGQDEQIWGTGCAEHVWGVGQTGGLAMAERE